jgi:diguanylate cyclase (GGDEF)-like protein/PAS domain S-box-containing protein
MPSSSPAAQASPSRPSEASRAVWMTSALLGLVSLVGFTLAVWLDGVTALLGAGVVSLVGFLVLLVRERGLVRRLKRCAEAMDALDLPLLIMDVNDRVRWASAAFTRLYDGLHSVEVGTPYDELVERIVATGSVTKGPADRAAWLASRLPLQADARQVRLQTLRNGRVVQVVERRTRDGGWTSVAFDLTDQTVAEANLRQARDAAQAANELLEDALDAMPAGFEIWSRDDRLLRCNRRVLDFYPGASDLLVPGVHFDDVVRRTLELQLIPSARGREGEWLEERIATRGRMARPLLIDYGGRWLQVEERRTRSGHLVTVRQEVTELVEARRALSLAQTKAERDHRLLYRAVDALPVAVEIYDHSDRLLLVNRVFQQWHPQVDYTSLLGKTFEEMVRISQAKGMLPLEAQADPEAWVRARVAAHGQHAQARLQRLPDGRSVLTQETRTPEGFVVTTRQDVTQLQRHEAALEVAHAQLQALVETAGTAIITFSTEGLLRTANLSAQALWGYPAEELVGLSIDRLVLEAGGWSLMHAIQRHLQGETSQLVGARHELSGQHRSGRSLIIQAAISEVKHGADHFFVGVVIDVTEQRQAEAALRQANARLEHLSATDPLTGLANRRRLMEALQGHWQYGMRERQSMAVLLIDVDHFKRYNDHHGHQAGDAALVAIGDLLQAVARRANDLAARYGGEEFVLLLGHCDAAGALARGQELRERLAALALPHGDAPLGRLSVSIGASSCVPDPQGRCEDLLISADAALYRAKAAGRDSIAAAD